jgi:hypothetical protein
MEQIQVGLPVRWTVFHPRGERTVHVEVDRYRKSIFISAALREIPTLEAIQRRMGWL